MTFILIEAEESGNYRIFIIFFYCEAQPGEEFENKPRPFTGCRAVEKNNNNNDLQKIFL